MPICWLCICNHTSACLCTAANHQSAASHAALAACKQVRFLAANLRGLFHTAQPWRDLPVVFGLPQGCFRMACALPFSTHFTSERLQQFVAARLLRLPALPPLSPRLLGAWCAAMPSGRVGVLALLRPGQQQPLPLLGAVAEARGRLQAAAAVWR